MSMRHIDNRSNRRVGGFTLVEILVVLVLMSLVTALAIPAFSGSSRSLQARETARDLYQVLRRARSDAISAASPVRLLLDYRQQRVEREQEGVMRLPAGMRMRGNARRPAETQILIFYPDGSASPADFSLVSAGREFRYHVEPLTGRVGLDVSVHDPS
jgi:type II secretion system protein H